MNDGKYVILYIDDDPDALFTVRAILESAGYSMLEASSAEEGLRVFKQSSPDLVIVDLMMEEVDAGAALVRDLRALGSKAPVFMLSSVGDGLNQTIDFSGLGLDGVFQKPLAPATLLGVLKTKLK